MPTVDHEKITLVIQGPDGTSTSKDFTPGIPPSVRLADLPGKGADGVYNWELRVTPRVSTAIKNQLAAARANDDAATVAKLQHANGLDRALTQSGVITVLNGAIINSDAPETPARGNATTASASPQQGTSTATRITPRAGTNTAVIVGDESIQGSLCVGLDCTASESFGFDTIRLKENNDRIGFDDTSTSTGFPNNDWQLTANDSASGGANKFSIDDITNSKTPFTVTAAAPTNSIFVASSGKVGFGNNSPGLNLHITATDTPAIRQEQTSGGGFTAQTWDIGGNEANWFVRDVTGGSRLPLRIRPGAPTSSIDISATGLVGVGTASPANKIHAFDSTDTNTVVQVQNTSATSNAAALFRSNSDTAQLSHFSHASTRTISRFGVTLGGWNEINAGTGNGLIVGTNNATSLILGTNAAARLTIDSSGNITVPGNFTVTGVKNFAVVDPKDEKKALYYTALEGPEAGTYFRGSAKTVNGEVEISLPEYFANLTEKERMTVQLTPVGGWGQIYVASKSPEKIVIKTAKGSDDLEFDFLVQGVRKGYLDYQVERKGAFPVQQ